MLKRQGVKVAGVSLEVSVAVSCCEVLPVRTDPQDSDPRFPVRAAALSWLTLALQVLRVFTHIHDPQQVLLRQTGYRHRGSGQDTDTGAQKLGREGGRRVRGKEALMGL